MVAIASQMDKFTYLKMILLKGSNMTDRQRLVAIVEAEIFNMKTVCNLSGLKYQTYCNARRVNFENASDKWIAALLETIDNIMTYYPS